MNENRLKTQSQSPIHLTLREMCKAQSIEENYRHYRQWGDWLNTKKENNGNVEHAGNWIEEHPWMLYFLSGAGLTLWDAVLSSPHEEAAGLLKRCLTALKGEEHPLLSGRVSVMTVPLMFRLYRKSTAVWDPVSEERKHF